MHTTRLPHLDEEHFRQHSKHWLRMKNRVEYQYGLTEYYDDPKSHIGTFQADVTVKSINVDSLAKLLPSFEKRFPFPAGACKHFSFCTNIQAH